MSAGAAEPRAHGQRCRLIYAIYICIRMYAVYGGQHTVRRTQFARRRRVVSARRGRVEWAPPRWVGLKSLGTHERPYHGRMATHGAPRISLKYTQHTCAKHIYTTHAALPLVWPRAPRVLLCGFVCAGAGRLKLRRPVHVQFLDGYQLRPHVVCRTRRAPPLSRAGPPFGRSAIYTAFVCAVLSRTEGMRGGPTEGGKGKVVVVVGRQRATTVT